MALFSNEMLLESMSPKSRAAMVNEYQVPMELQAAHEQELELQSAHEGAEEKYGRLVGSMIKAADMMGIGFMTDPQTYRSLIGTESKPGIVRTGRHPDGYRVGQRTDGQVVRLNRVGTDTDTGKRIAELPDGTRYWVGETESPLAGAAKRLSGVLLGALAVRYGHPVWGFMKGSMETAKEAEERGYGPLEQTGLAMVGGIQGGIQSSLETILKEGSWGTTFPDMTRAVTGKTVAEHLRDKSEKSLELAEEGWVKSAIQGFNKVIPETVDLMIELAAEGGIATGPHFMSKRLREIKYGRGPTPRFTGPPPDIDKGPGTFGEIVRKAEEKQAKAIMSGSLGRTMKDIDYLLKNPKELEAMTRSITDKRNLIGMDETLSATMDKVRRHTRRSNESLVGIEHSPPPKPSSQSIDQYIDWYINTKFLDRYRPEHKAAIKPFEYEGPLITLEATGLKQAFEMLGEGFARTNRWIKRNWGEKVPEIDGPGAPIKQAQDVQNDVLKILEHEYQRTVRPESVDSVMRRKAGDWGWSLRETKKGWNLSKEIDGKKKIVRFDDLDQVADFLNLGKKANKYAKEEYKFKVHVNAQEGLADFEAKYFPDGIEHATPRQWSSAVNQLQRNINRGPKELFGDRWLKQVRTVLGRVPSGNAFWKLIRKAEDTGMIAFANDLADVEKILRESGILTKSGKELNPGLLDDVRMYLDGLGIERRAKSGEVIPPSVDNPVAQSAAEAIRPILDKIYGRARDVGINVANYRQNYFPHSIPRLEALEAGAKRKEILNAAVKEGLFDDLAHATKVLDGYIKRAKGNRSDNRFIEWLARKRGITFSEAEKFWDEVIMPKYTSVTGHLTKHRMDRYNPFYDRNLLTGLSDYMMDAHRAISQYDNLGPRKENAWKLINRMRVEGGNYELAEDVLGRISNPNARKFRGPNDWQRKAMTFQSITKLNPLTTVVNMSQNLATALRTSPSATMKAIAGYDKDFAARAGAIVNQTIKDIMAAHGATSALGTKYLRSIGFTDSERILRTIASNAGKFHLMDMAELLRKGKRTDYARRQIRSFGLDPDEIARRGRVTDEELQLAGKRVSDETQFRGNIMDLPEQWLTGHGRLLTQFKTFVYNQAMLLKRSVVDEARHGNYRPLVFLLSAYPIAGAGYDTLVNQILLGKESPDSLPDWYFRGLTAVGGLGIAQTAFESTMYGEKALMSDLLGPTIGDFIKASQSYKLFIGKDFPLAKETFGRAPYLGRVLRNRAFESRKRPKRKSRKRRPKR